jgi:hypothetical protein
MKQCWTNCFNLSFNSEYGVHLCTEGKGINVIACGDGLLCFFS